MRAYAATRLATWMCVALLVCGVSGCPDTSAGTDASGDVVMSADVANDLEDAGIDATLDVLRPMDGANDVDGAADAPEVPTAGCVPGMSIACACVDGRAGAQVCQPDRTYAACVCATPDAGAGDASVSDVVLPPLGARLIAPQSVSRVTSRRPTMRWVLPDGVTRARVEVCGDRACSRVLVTQVVEGSSWRPSAMLPPGVAYWRVRGLDGDGGVAWSSATWEYVVGQRDAPVDTSFGTIKDFNGDGYDDVAVPSSTALDNNINIFLGRRAGGSLEPDIRFNTGLNYIYSQAVGDFNGDGFADLASASPARQDSARDYLIQVRYGSRTGLSMEPSITLRQSDSSWFAQKTAVADINGDGFSDLVALAGDESGAHNLVVAFIGREGGLHTVPEVETEAPDGYPRPGFLPSFESVEDVNGDGYADLLTGWGDGSTSPGQQIGRAWLIPGQPTHAPRVWAELPHPTSRYHFGATLTGVGDLNGDGTSDFAIRSDEEVSIYLGMTGSLPMRPAMTIRNPEEPCYLATFGFGSALGRAGDFDGDGRAELVVGASCLPYQGSLRRGPGTVFVYQGHPMGVGMVPTIFRGSVNEADFGGGVGGTGDFNGDGFGDLTIVQSLGGVIPGTTDIIVPPAIYVCPGSTIGASFLERWIFSISGWPRFYPAIAALHRVASSTGG